MFFTARDTNEIMLLAFILKDVDFYEEYKLRPGRTLFNVKCRNQSSPIIKEVKL